MATGAPCRQDVTPLPQVQPPPYPPPHLSVPGPDPGPSGGQTEVPRPTQFSWSHLKTLASPRRPEIQQTVLILQDKGLAAWGGGGATRGQEGAQDPARGPLRGGSAQLPKGLPTSTPGSPRDSKRSPRPLFQHQQEMETKARASPGTSQQLRLVRKHNSGLPPRGPRRPSSTPTTSHLWAPLSKPRAGHPPRPSTLRLRVAQLPGPPACASLEHSSAPRPSQPLQRTRARRGWTRPLDEEAWPHKLGAPLCRHPGTWATRVQGASCLRFDRAETPKPTPRVATANRRTN